MDMQACTEKLRDKVGEQSGLNASLKFDCGTDGVIVLDGKSAASDLAKVEAQRRTERQKLEDAARKQAEQDKALAAKLAADRKADAKPATNSGTAKVAAKAAPAKKTTAKADTTRAGGKAPAKATAKARTTAAPKAARAPKSDKD